MGGDTTRVADTTWGTGSIMVAGRGYAVWIVDTVWDCTGDIMGGMMDGSLIAHTG